MDRPDPTPAAAWSPLRFALVLLAMVFLPQALLGLAVPALAAEGGRWTPFLLAPLAVTMACGVAMWRVVVRPLCDAARAERAKYDAVLASAGDCLFTTDEDGHVRSFNAAAERLFGYPASEILGRDVGVLLPASTLEAGLLEPEEVVGRRKDGTTFRAELSLSGVDVGEARVFIGILRDVTDRRQAEQWLHARARQQSAIATLGQEALAGGDLDALLATAASLAAIGVGGSHAAVLELQPGGKAFRLRAGVGWNEGLVGRTTVSARSEMQAGFALVSGQPVTVDDAGKDRRFGSPPLLRDHGLMSGACVVIAGTQTSWGVLAVHATAPRAWSEDDTNFLQALASVLASAIVRAGVQPSPSRHAPATLDAAALLDDVSGDTTRVAHMVELFRSGAPRLVARIRDEMTRRAADGNAHDLAEAEAALHALEQDLARLAPALANLAVPLPGRVPSKPHEA